MPLLKTSRVAQYPLVAEFTFTIGDTMVNTAGASDAFATVAAHVFDVINLPSGAVVLSGEVVTDTAFAGSTAYNVTVGDSASAARYLGTTDRTTAARTALVPTGYLGLGEQIRLTVTPTVAAATAGKITLRVVYAITGRAQEVQPT
ncbi:MAG: hypothetical protein Q8N51_05770 [Gammaproteobacteria bacterium]|nr:hypothetical protein [Gammaproteobacteria bacterium]